MPSVSNFQTALEGILVTQIDADDTVMTIKVKEINGVTPTWLTTAHRVTVIQKTRTVTKVEVMSVAAGTTQSGSTVTSGTLTRGLPLDGTGFTGTGTPQVFSSGARVIITWDAQAGRQTAFKDITNTFDDHQTIAVNKELRLADSATAIWNDGSDLNFKSSTTAAKTLAQLAANSGSDEKVKITATDTTQQYLDDALLVTSPITKTTNNSGANETLTIALDTVPVTKGGTGLITGTTAYAPIFTGTTATGNFQAGTAGTANQILTSNGAAAIPTFQAPKYYSQVLAIRTSDGSEVAANTTSDQTLDTYTFNANTLTAGDLYKIEAAIGIVGSTTPNATIKINFPGSGNSMPTLTIPSVPAYAHAILTYYITVRTIGATGTIHAWGHLIATDNSALTTTKTAICHTASGSSNNTPSLERTVDTTASNAMTLDIAFNAGSTSNKARRLEFVLTKFNSTAF